MNKPALPASASPSFTKLRARLRVAALLFGYLVFLSAASYAQQTAATEQRAVLNRYCVTCHNEKLKTAGLMLDHLDVKDPGAAAETWEKVVKKLRASQMPPAGAPRPAESVLASLVDDLETGLDQAAATSLNPGRTILHRLNRNEYAAAVGDLLGVDPGAIDMQALLPADDAGYGFDNIGDVLTVSPLLMEGYLSAARKISRLAVGNRNAQPVSETYESPKYELQNGRMSEDLPFGSRGGTSIRHFFPLDGEYTIKIRLQRNADYYVLGLAARRQIEVRLDGARIGAFAFGGSGDEDGTFGATSFGSSEAREDADFEVRAGVRAGMRALGVTFPNVTLEPEGVYLPPVTDYGYAMDYGNPDVEPALGSVTIAGPYDAKGLGETASRERIFTCRPTPSLPSFAADAERQCAARILSTLARRAYRRPVTAEDTADLMEIYTTSRSMDGNGMGAAMGGFEEGIQTGIQRILVDPEFLFRIERDPSGLPPRTAYRVNDIELASRLSFFLWSSIPDEELLTVAERGRLQDPAVLEGQVRRMLADPRSAALVENFAGQWLYLRNVKAVWPNPDVFPDFSANLRHAFQAESELFFESMLREDRSVLDLLRADYTYVNEPLARHYGIPNVYGNHFRRVPLTDENRHGLLGQGSILSVTSYATRTSPVMRGKWVLEQLMGTPPPPPPPDVPSLEEKNEENGRSLTMREQMERHRVNPACASCHKIMDPLGFALDNFDATGRWREMEGNTPIDSSGILPDGTEFHGPVELRNHLLKRPEQIVHTITEKLLTYALGRGVEYYDVPAIRKIIRDARPTDYRWSSLILGIVDSPPFRMRRTR